LCIGIGTNYNAKPYEPGLGKGEYAKKFLEARGTYILVGITLQNNNENNDAADSLSQEASTPIYTPLLEGVTGGAGRFAGKALNEQERLLLAYIASLYGLAADRYSNSRCSLHLLL